jgi:hypothetical protein
MKSIHKTLLILCLSIIITFSSTADVVAAPLDDDRTILGSTYTLESGNILDGNLNVIGGLVTIQQDAVVRGNIYVLGGLVNLDGLLNGNLIIFGGTVNLGETAVIDGDLISPASYVNKDAQAVIKGSQTEGLHLPWGTFVSPQIPQITPYRQMPYQIMPVFSQLASGTAVGLLITALGALLLLLMPKSVERMTLALTAHPLHVLGYGALTAAVMLIGGIILTVTICLIPIVILAGLSVGLAALAGWLTLGYALGKQMESNIFKTTWHPVLTAVLGNLVLYLFASALDLIPCIGGFLVFVASLFGLGVVVVTLFGTRDYPRGSTPSSMDRIILNDQMEDGNPSSPSVDAVISGAPEPNQSIDELEISPQTNSTLKAAGILTINDVLSQLKEKGTAVLNLKELSPEQMDELLSSLGAAGYISHQDSTEEPTDLQDLP